MERRRKGERERRYGRGNQISIEKRKKYEKMLRKNLYKTLEDIEISNNNNNKKNEITEGKITIIIIIIIIPPQ